MEPERYFKHFKGGMVYSLPIELIVQTLRNMGYAGELKKVTVTNI